MLALIPLGALATKIGHKTPANLLDLQLQKINFDPLALEATQTSDIVNRTA